MVEADILTLHSKNYLSLVDYHSKFPIIKNTEDLLANSLILACKIIFFSRIWLTNKNNVRCRNYFISEIFEKCCKKLNIECAASSSYHYKANGQVEA